MRLTTAVLMWFAVSSYAQQPAPSTLVQRVDVTLVNVDVTVLDRRGNPVSDLGKDDFQLLEDGVPREISNFSFVRNANTPAKPDADPDFASDPDRRRSVVVLVDIRSLGEKPHRARAIDALEKLLAEYPESSNWSIVILREGLRSMETLLPMTTDRGAIKQVLDAVREGVSLRSNAEAVINRVKPFGVPVCANGCAGADLRAGVDAAQEMASSLSFYSAVVQLARGVAWLPGKKVILIVSSAVPGYLSPVAGASAIQAAELHKWMVEEANTARANVYVIDPLGIDARIEMGHGDYFAMEANLPRSSGQRDTAAAEWLALNTGGLYLPSNDMKQSLEKLQRATTNYYELAFHAAEADRKYHRITVTVKRPGRYTVTHRHGYVRLSSDDAFVKAMMSPLGIASQKPTLDLRLTTGDAQASADGSWKVPFRAALPMKSLQALSTAAGPERHPHVYVSVFDKDGRLVQFFHFAETVRGVFPDGETLVVSRSVEVQKGAYRIFVTVRDELSDQVGVATKETAF